MPRKKQPIFKVGDAVKYNFPWDCVYLPRGAKGKVISVRKKTRERDFYEVPEDYDDIEAIKDPYEYQIEWFEVAKGIVQADKDGGWSPATDLELCKEDCDKCKDRFICFTTR